MPARGYDLRLIPPVPLPRKPTVDLLRVPGRVRRAVAETRALLDELRRRRRRRLRRLRGAAGLPRRPPRRACRSSCTSRTRCRAWPTGSAPGWPPGSAVTDAGHAAAPRRARRHAAAPRRITLAGPRRPAGPRRGPPSGWTPTGPTLLVVRRLAGRGHAQPRRRSAPPTRSPPPASRCCTRAGPKNTDVAVPPRPAGQAPYVVVDYLERMDLAYAAADLVLCRSGAVTVAELSAVGLPAVFVPLPIGNGEQRRNALPVVEAGGGLLVEDADLTPAWIAAHLVPLLTDPTALAGYARHAAAAGVPDADERLADDGARGGRRDGA